MLAIIFHDIHAASLNKIVSGGQRQYSGQRFFHPKMKGQEEGKPMNKGPTPKLRGHPKDSPDSRLSKSLSWLLRHGAEKAGLNIRQDGYARVSDVVSLQHQRCSHQRCSLCQTAFQPHVQRCHIYALTRHRETRSKVKISSSF